MIYIMHHHHLLLSSINLLPLEGPHDIERMAILRAEPLEVKIVILSITFLTSFIHKNKTCDHV